MPACSAASAITNDTFSARVMKPARRRSTASGFCATRPACCAGATVFSTSRASTIKAAGTAHICGHAEKLVVPGAANLLLSHNPDVFPVAVRKGYDAVMSGHTHGGQVTVEILNQTLNIARFATPYVAGLYRLQGRSCYVTAGIGTIALPVRIGAPPEITVVSPDDEPEASEEPSALPHRKRLAQQLGSSRSGARTTPAASMTGSSAAAIWPVTGRIPTA